jgi:hypothetical protein
MENPPVTLGLTYEDHVIIKVPETGVGLLEDFFDFSIRDGCLKRGAELAIPIPLQ